MDWRLAGHGQVQNACCKTQAFIFARILRQKNERRGSFEQRASLSGFDLSVFQRVENIWKELQMWN